MSEQPFSEQPFSIDLASRLKVNPNLVLRIEDDECALLFDPDNNRVQILNDTAVAVWQRLDGRRTLREVLEELAAVYDGMDESADRQVLAVVRELAALGAVGIPEPG